MIGKNMDNNVVLVALFAAVIAALGLIPKITLISGVPITAQSLGIMLCGTILGARTGAQAALLFLGLTALGLPLLAGGRGGLAVFASPSVGFLIGFPIAAFVTGWSMQRSARLSIGPASALAALIGGIIALYIPGVIGLSIMIDKPLLASLALVVPFLPGDLIKVILCAVITRAIYSARPQMILAKLPQPAPGATTQAAENPPQNDEER